MPFLPGRESIAAKRTSISTRSSSDGEGSGSIISGRSSDIDDAQTYPGGRDTCDHGKPRLLVTGKWFAAERELEGQAQPRDPYRNDAVVSPGVVKGFGPWRERKRNVGRVKRDRTSEECGVREGGRAMTLLRPDSIMMAYGRGRDSDMVQCVIARDVSMTFGTVGAGELCSHQAKDSASVDRVIPVTRSYVPAIRTRVVEVNSVRIYYVQHYYQKAPSPPKKKTKQLPLLYRRP